MTDEPDNLPSDPLSAQRGPAGSEQEGARQTRDKVAANAGRSQSNADALHLENLLRAKRDNRTVDPDVLEALRRSDEAEGLPPVVVSKRYRGNPASEFSDFIQDVLGSQSYGAPRVFDLYTLLAVTLAFALLFSSLRLLEPLFPNSIPQIALALASFLTLTAISQMVLWGGKQPRLASLFAGPFCWIAVGLMIALQSPATFRRIETPLGIICSSVLGIFAGYLMGGLVAGVFLLAEMLRSKFQKSVAAESSSVPEIWGDEDAVGNSPEEPALDADSDSAS